MKSKHLLLLMLLALFAPWAANAQNRTTVTIGNGTYSQNFPLPGYWGYQYDVFLYTPTAAQELGVDSDISSLAFNVASNSSLTGAEMYIWVKDVDANYALSASTTFAQYITDATQVYSNDDFTSTSGWNTFNFSSTFSHQGGKALLVAVRGVGCSASGGCSRSCYYTTASNTYWYKRADSNDPGQTVSGSVDSNRANIQLSLTYTGAVCFAPTGLTYSNVTDNAATLSWTENGSSTSWTLEYGTASNYSGATQVPVSGTPSTSLSGLSGTTTYYVRVKADCGSDWLEGSFTTTAVATAVGDSWSDDFEGESCGWQLINGDLTNKWCWGTAASNGGTHGLYVSNDNGTTNAYSHSTAIVFATKLLNFTEGKFEFSYDWNANGESNYDYLRVALVPATVTLTAGTMPSGFSYNGLPSGWFALDGGSKLNQSTSWQNKTLPINVTAGNYFLVMAWRNDGGGGTQPPAAVDNMSITRVACPYDVTGLALSGDPTTNSATITWTAGEASEWQVATKAGSGEWVTLSGTYNTNSANLTGLTSSTNYQVRVRAYCNSNDQGTWCDPISFTTACEIFTIDETHPYTENFDGITAGSGVLPVCWSRINTGSSYSTYPMVNGSSANSPSNCLYFYSYGSSYTSTSYVSDQYAILREIENLAGKQITLSAKGYNASSTFKIGMMSNPADATTFTEIATQELTTSYQEFIYSVPANATATYIAIKMERPNASSNVTRGVYIDDITIANPPACPKPTDLAVVANSVTAHEAQLSWTSDASAWEIKCWTGTEPDDAEATIVPANTNPFTIDNLADETTFTVRVRAVCDGTPGEWSTNTVSFTTPIACPAPTGLAVSNTTGSQTTLNWTGNSDSYDVMYRKAAYVDGVYEEFDASGVPSGWMRYSGLVDAVIAGTATLSTSSYWSTNTYALGTYNMALNIYGTSCKYWLVTPEFNLSQNLSFDLALTDFNNADPIEDNTAQSDDRFVVLIYADEAWHILREWNNTGSEYVYNTISYTGENVTINLSDYQGKDVKIAFYGESTNPSTMQNTGGDNHLHIDNVHCGIPYEAGEWITHNQDPVIGTTYTLDGLDPETDYDVKVKSNCDGETSHETAVVSFTTEAACMVPNTVAVVANSVTAHTAQLSWNSDASAWEICLNGDEAHPVTANTNPFELTGLTDGETFTAKVRANCNGSYTDWSSEVSFTTPLACPAPTGLAVSGITGSQTTLTWTGESDSYEVYYGEVTTLASADFSTGDFNQANFTNSTTYPWTVVDKVAKSAGGFSSDQSDLTLQVTGPGILQFRAKISSESNYDYGRFSINGTQKVNISGAGSWIDYEYELAAGNNTLVWSYYKDGNGNSNDDCFYVDDIIIFDPEITWEMDGTTEELTYTLDGLDAETNYQVKVKSVCTDETGHETAAVSFTTEAACMVPNELAAVPATTTADLSWTSDASAWQISTGDDNNPISLTSETTGVTINGTTVSYTLTGLTPSTTYTFKVRAVCDGTPSEWSETMSFTTECVPFTITAETPYTQDFESPVVTAAYNSSNADLIKMPNCWDNYHADATNQYQYYKPHLIKSNAGSDGYNYSSPASQVLYFYGNGNGYAALPEFTNALNTLQISFKWATEGSSQGTLSLGYITAEDNGTYNTFTQIGQSFAASSESYRKMKSETVYLNNVPATATRLVFRWYYSSWYGANIDDVEVSLLPTFTKTIAGYGEGDGNWYLIASPLADDVDPTTVGMITDELGETATSETSTYDLYRFDQTQSDEWLNYRKTSFNLANGTGYLYANKNDVTLTFAGLPYDGNSKVVTLSNDPGENTTTHLAGYNLVGNPFTVNAYIGDRDFYVMNNGTEIILADRAAEGEAEYIEPMEGVFVIATENNEQLTFTTTAPESKGASLALNVNKNRGVVDRAMVRFGEGRTLPKFQLRNNSTKVYIPQDNIDYAVVSAEAMGELPVNFRANENGSYTLSFTSEEVSFSYLHLVDNMTGNDVDLLQTPSYTFDALTTDYESRFKLVFATGNAADDSFAFYSNGNWIINNDGRATLQVIDVTGRILSSETVNGSVSTTINAAPGVYMLRLVNGDNVKVQKVVVR